MSLFDLVFVVVVLTTLVSLASSAVVALRGRRDRARRRLGRLALGLFAYMGLVTLVSLISQRRVVALGEDRCSDDWCVAVVSTAAVGVREDAWLDVQFRLSSHALRVSQRERFVVAYVLDGAANRYDADPGYVPVPFDTLLGPGESVLTSRRFSVPATAGGLGVVVAREGDFAFPRCCIIGQGPFFKYPIVYVDAEVGASGPS